MRIVLLSVLIVLLVFMVTWFGWGIYDLYYLKVPPLSVVFIGKMPPGGHWVAGKRNYMFVDMPPGGHWVYSKGNYIVESLLPPGRDKITDDEVFLLRKVAKEDGWENFRNYRAAMAGE